MTVLLAQPASARLPIGQQVAHAAESPHPYGAGSLPGDLVWSHSIAHPGALGMWVHFSAFDLAPGDWVVVRDAGGSETETFTDQGRQNAGAFWSRRIPGEDLVVELWSTGSSPGLGVAIDEYAWGYEPIVIEGICGVNDLEDAICQQLLDADAVDRARAVARLTIFADDGTVYSCTGFRIECPCHFLTTATCIGSVTEALNANYEFNANSLACRMPPPPGCSGEPPTGNIRTRGTLLITDPPLGLDFSLIGNMCYIDGSNPVVHIDRRLAQAGWRIDIPQHAGGCLKQFGARDTTVPSGLCEVAG